LRLCVVSTGSPTYDAPPRLGGIQRQIWGMASEYARKGHETSLLSRKGLESSAVRGILHHMTVQVGSNNEVLARLSFSKKAARLVKQLDPDIIELHERFSAVFPARIIARKAFFAHNYDAMKFYEGFSRSRNAANWIMFPVKNWVEEDCMRRCDVVFSLNGRDREYLERRRLGRVQQIPNGIDPTLYRQGPDGGYILFVGRLDRVKGIDIMTQMFEKLAQETDIDLHVVGGGPLLSEIMSWRSRAGLADRVKILGWISFDHLREEFAHSSFLILPSFYETFGIVTLEAMASGKPVVASRIPGPEEVVRHGVSGFLFTPRSAEDLTVYCRLLAGDRVLRTQLGRNARSDVERSYTFDAVSSEVLHTYEKILSPGET